MQQENFSLTVHLVASLDGMIAKKDNSVDWFDTKDFYEAGVSISDSAAAAFLQEIDAYVMGAKTYEHAVALSRDYGWPYGDKPTVVVTHRLPDAVHPAIEFYSGDLTELVQKRLRPRFKNVWIAGGASLGSTFIRRKLVDEIRLTILPVILGEGIPFFDHNVTGQPLHLENVTAYRNGSVELRYRVPR